MDKQKISFSRHLFSAAALFTLLVPLWAQTGTAHGITLTATPATTNPAGVTVTGVNFYSCGSGTIAPTVCSTNRTKLNSAPIAVATPTLFLPASQFTAGTTYYFVATDFAAATNDESADSPIASATANFPANPNPPGCNASVQ